MAVRHFFYAASPSATVTNKPFILTISCLRNGRQYHTFSIYAKISADKIKRRQNARTPVDKVTLESDSTVMPQEAKVAISSSFNLESSGADSNTGFIFRVETKGGVRSSREGQHYVLLQRNACYGVDVPDASEVVDITLTMPQGKKDSDVQSLKLVHWRLGERAPSWTRAASEAESLAVRPSTSFPKRVDATAAATPTPLPLPSSSGLNTTPLGRNSASSSLLTDLLLPPMASTCSAPGFNSAPALSAAPVSLPPVPPAPFGFGFNNQFSDPYSFPPTDSLDSSLSWDNPFMSSFVPSLTNTVPSFGNSGLDVDNALDADEKEFLAHSAQTLTSTLSTPFPLPMPIPTQQGPAHQDGCSLSDGFFSDASSPSLSPVPASGKSVTTGAISTDSPSDYSEASSPNFEDHSVIDSASSYSHLPLPAHRLPSNDTVMMPVTPAVASHSHSLSALSPSIASSSSSSNSKRKRNPQPKRRFMMAPRHWNITSRRAPFRTTITAPERLEGHAVSIVFGGETLDASRLDVNGRTCIVDIPEWQGNVPTVSSIEVDVQVMVDGEPKFGTTFVYILSPSAAADADNSDESEDDDESDSDESGDRNRRGGGGPSGKRQKGAGNGNGSVRLFASFDSLSSFKGFFSNQSLQSGFVDMVQSYLNGKFTIDDLESARSLMEAQATAAFTNEKQLASPWLKEAQAVVACTSDKYNRFPSPNGSLAQIGSDGSSSVMAHVKPQPPPFRDKSRSSDETGAHSGTNMDVDSSAAAERVDPSSARELQQQAAVISRSDKAADERGRLFVLSAQRNQMRAFISHALKEIATYKQVSGQLNELDARGFTIVHYVAALGEPSLLQRLVSAGADVNVTGDNDAYSALDLAKQRFVMVHATWDQMQKQRGQGAIAAAADTPATFKSAEDQYSKMTQVLKILKEAGAYERTAIPAQARPFLQALLQLRSAIHSVQRDGSVTEPAKAAFSAVAKSDDGFKSLSAAAPLPTSARELAALPPDTVWKAVLGQLQAFMEQQDVQQQIQPQTQQQFVAPAPRVPKQSQPQTQLQPSSQSPTSQYQPQSQHQPYSQFCAATSSGGVDPQVPTAPFRALPTQEQLQPSEPPIVQIQPQSQSLVQPQAMSAFQKQVFGLAASDPLWQQIIRFIQLLPPVVPPIVSASASSSSSSSFVSVTSSSLGSTSMASVQSASGRAQALLEQLRGVVASYLANRSTTVPVTQQLAALRIDGDAPSSGTQRTASAFAVCQRTVLESQFGAGSRASSSAEPLFLKVRTVFADLVPARKFFSDPTTLPAPAPGPAASLSEDVKASPRDAAGGAASSNKEQRRALCIGVNSYVGPSAGSLPSLRGCVNDAHKFAAVLREKYQFDKVVVLVDELASRRSILDQLESLVRQSQRGDVAVLYFAGHGSANGIVGHDGAVTMEELQRLISQCVTPHVVFVVDACSSSKPPLALSADSGNGLTCIRGVELTVLDRSPMVRHSSLEGGASPSAHANHPPSLVRAWSLPSQKSGCATQVMSPATSCGVLAAACGPLQVAKEKQFDGAWHGIFTHYLCEELCMLGTDRPDSTASACACASASGEDRVDLPVPSSAAGDAVSASSNETLLRLVLSKQPNAQDELGDHMFRKLPTEDDPHLGCSSTISGAELGGQHFRSLEQPTPPVPPDVTNATNGSDDRSASAAACPLSDATIVAQVFDRVARKVCAVSQGAQNPKVYTASRSGSPAGALEDSPRSPVANAAGEQSPIAVMVKLPGTTSVAADLAAIDVRIDSEKDGPEADWIQIRRGGQKLQLSPASAASNGPQRKLKNNDDQVPALARENVQVTVELPRNSLKSGTNNNSSKIVSPLSSSSVDDKDSASANKRRNKKRNKKSWTAVAAAASSHATTTAAALATTAAPLTATTSATSSLLGIPFSQVLLSLTLYLSIIAVVAALVCWLSPQASASAASFISLPLVPFRIAFPALFTTPPASEEGSSSRLAVSSILSAPAVTVTGLNAPLDWSKSAQYFTPDVLDAMHHRLPSDLIQSAALAPDDPSISPGDPPTKNTQWKLPSTLVQEGVASDHESDATAPSSSASSASAVLSSSALVLSTPLAALAAPIPCALSIWAHHSDPPLGQAPAATAAASSPAQGWVALAPEPALVPSPHAEAAKGGPAPSSASAAAWIHRGASAICTAVSPSPLCLSSAAALAAVTPASLSLISDGFNRLPAQDSKPEMVSISTQTEDLPSASAPATVLRGLLLDDWWAAEGDQPGASKELGDEGSVEGLEGALGTNEGEQEQQVPRPEARTETAEVSVVLQGWNVDVQPTTASETGGVSSAASTAAGAQPTPPHTSDREELQSGASTQDSPIVLLGVAELEHERSTALASDRLVGAAPSGLSPCPSSAPFADKCESVPLLQMQDHGAPAPSGFSQPSIPALAPAVAQPVPERLDRSAGGSQPLLQGSEVVMSSSDLKPVFAVGDAVQPRSSALQEKMPQTQTPALPIVQQRSSPRHLSKVLRGALTSLRNQRSALTAQRVFGTSSHVDPSPQQLWAQVAAQSNVLVHSGGPAPGPASSASQAEAAELHVPYSSALLSDPSSAISPSESPSEQQLLCQGRGRAELFVSRGQEGQDGATASSFDLKSLQSADLPGAVPADSPSGPSAGRYGASQQREPLSALAPSPAGPTTTGDSPNASARSSASLDKSTMTAVPSPKAPSARSPSLPNDLESEQSLPSVGSG